MGWNTKIKEIIDDIINLDFEIKELDAASGGASEELEGAYKESYDASEKKADEFFLEIKEKIYDFLKTEKDVDSEILAMMRKFENTPTKYMLTSELNRVLKINSTTFGDEIDRKREEFKQLIETKYVNWLVETGKVTLEIKDKNIDIDKNNKVKEKKLKDSGLGFDKINFN